MTTTHRTITERDREQAHAAGMRLITPDDDEWPRQALQDLGAADRPEALWLRGNARLDDALHRAVTLVGTRVASGYGEYIAADWAFQLASAGVSVCSGAAYGIDASARRGALAAEGVTVAVLGCGLDAGYPAGHAALLHNIAEHGVLVSEHPPGTPPTRLSLHSRQRLLAAFGTGTVIIEADVHSGALAAAEAATALGRPVMAVPGPITARGSLTCNQMIRAGQASLVTSTAEVIETLATACGDR